MSNLTKMMFLLSTIMSTLMVISSSSWMNMWLGMEVNLMSFIPLMSKSKNKFISQSMMMYFLTQSLASMVFIIVILMNKNFFMLMSENMMNNIIIIIMMMKMGMPPFHMWLPQIMMKMNWKMCLLLMTWQKVAPLYIMTMMTEMKPLIMIMICVSTTMGALGGLNQTSIQKMMAYSSMNHMGWLVSCTMMWKKTWTTYILLYTIIMMMLLMMFNEYNIIQVNQLSMMNLKMEKLTMMSMMLSIGGLPPFLGFIPKWLVIQNMMNSKEFIMMLVMIMSSLLTLSYYLRVTSSVNLTMSQSQKWMKAMPENKYMTMNMFTINLTLPLLIMLLNFM